METNNTYIKLVNQYGAFVKTSLFAIVLMFFSHNANSKSSQALADAMIDRTELQQLAASFNLEGGYRVKKGVSIWIAPIYTGSESYTLDGVTNTVNQWYTLADAKWFMAHQLYANNLFNEALKAAEEAKDIYDSLNNNVGQTMGFWKVNQITQVSFPAQGWATIAYEDLFPNEGDADYNDLVVNMRVTENYNRNDELMSIRMDFVPRARGAGYNHEFITVTDGAVDPVSNITFMSEAAYNGVGYATVRRHGANGLEVSRDTYTGGADLIIFPDTSIALPRAPGTFAANTVGGKCLTEPQVTTRVNIVITDPANNKLQDRSEIGVAQYRPVLHVKTTGWDIDVADVDSSIIIGRTGGINAKGYPFGIVIPANWNWPMEYQHIELAYPLFADYRQTLLSGVASTNPDVAQWYNFPSPDAATYVFDPAKFIGICQ
jgi:LruC domain-containing protein